MGIRIISIYSYLFIFLLIISQEKKSPAGESVGEVVCKSLTLLGKLPLDHPVCFFVLRFVLSRYIYFHPQLCFGSPGARGDMLILEIF